MVTKEQAKEIVKLSPELKYLKKELSAVKYGGNFNVAKMLNFGLIKQHTLKKGRMEQGVIVGAKKKWILTEKGKRMYGALNGLGF